MKVELTLNRQTVMLDCTPAGRFAMIGNQLALKVVRGRLRGISSHGMCIKHNGNWITIHSLKFRPPKMRNMPQIFQVMDELEKDVVMFTLAGDHPRKLVTQYALNQLTGFFGHLRLSVTSLP